MIVMSTLENKPSGNRPAIVPFKLPEKVFYKGCDFDVVKDNGLYRNLESPALGPEPYPEPEGGINWCMRVVTRNEQGRELAIVDYVYRDLGLFFIDYKQEDRMQVAEVLGVSVDWIKEAKAGRWTTIKAKASQGRHKGHR
ncbi:MAG: hypothetical protein C5B58_11745 [Acidobacteria bacterium]|nr:MAG: hypothetical protein C5B58_11745 [Acidobacteriota bacterium]